MKKKRKTTEFAEKVFCHKRVSVIDNNSVFKHYYVQSTRDLIISYWKCMPACWCFKYKPKPVGVVNKQILLNTMWMCIDAVYLNTSVNPTEVQ